MTTIAEATLSDAERRALEAAVAELRRELGEELLAVWLYGSRARGEGSPVRGQGLPARDADATAVSDVDLMVIAADASHGRWERVHDLVWGAAERAGAPYWSLSVHLRDPAWIADRRAVESFFLRDVERDRIVLLGPEGGDLPGLRDLTERARSRYASEPQAVRPRSREELERAHAHLRALAALAGEGDRGIRVGMAYYAMLHAARAALSEEELEARTHSGTWALFHERFVRRSRFDGRLAGLGTRYQELRERSEYGRIDPGEEGTARAAEAARDFVAAVERMIGG